MRLKMSYNMGTRKYKSSYEQTTRNLVGIKTLENKTEI